MLINENATLISLRFTCDEVIYVSQFFSLDVVQAKVILCLLWEFKSTLLVLLLAIWAKATFVILNGIG